MLRISLIQNRCGRRIEYPDPGYLFGSFVILISFLASPGLLLWAVPVAIVSSWLMLALMPIKLAIEWLGDRSAAQDRIDAAQASLLPPAVPGFARPGEQVHQASD